MIDYLSSLQFPFSVIFSLSLIAYILGYLSGARVKK